MIIETAFEQGTPEWFAARAGIPSASNFSKIVTSTGAKSKSVTGYVYELAGERLLGTKPEGYTNAAMERGIELESEARAAYEMLFDVDVQEVAMCYKDGEKRFSCSPDGLVEPRIKTMDYYGGIEIKCPNLNTHIEYLYKGVLPAKYVAQVQGSLYITGCEYWDFVSYFPGVDLFCVRVYPDQKFHELLEAALLELCERVNMVVEEIRK